MTVNEMIQELVKMTANGYGDSIVLTNIITDDGGDDVHGCEYYEQDNTVRIF